MTRSGSRREQTPAESGLTVVGAETHGPKPLAAAIAVADILPASKPLPEVPADRAIQGLLASLRPAQASSHRPLEARSRLVSGLVAGVDRHPLIAALELSYSGHRPLGLSPDMVWLLICQGVGYHIDAHAEALRSHFVAHPGRLTCALAVRSGRSVRSGPRWEEVLDGLWREIRRQIGASADSFIPAFTTTGSVERVAAELALFSAVRSYAHPLRTDTDCGIPSVTLEGTTADWEQIVDRLRGFSGLGLDRWLESLYPALHQFAAAADGNIDRTFWSEIYRPATTGGSPPSSSLGWLIRFIPDLVSDESLAAKRGHPLGLSSAPLTWDQRASAGRLIHRREMELLGGFVGVSQHPDTLRLRPEIGWAIRERDG